MSNTTTLKCEKCGALLWISTAESLDVKVIERNGQYMKTKEVAKELGVSERKLEDERKEVAEGSVWAQCQKGLYHVMQVKILVLLQTSKITLKEAEAKWSLFKDNFEWAVDEEIARVKEEAERKKKSRSRKRSRS